MPIWNYLFIPTCSWRRTEKCFVPGQARRRDTSMLPGPVVGVHSQIATTVLATGGRQSCTTAARFYLWVEALVDFILLTARQLRRQPLKLLTLIARRLPGLTPGQWSPEDANFLTRLCFRTEECLFLVEAEELRARPLLI